MKKDKVLLVSPNRDTFALCSKILENETISLQTVSGCDDAMEFLVEDFIGVIIIDASVPDVEYPGLLRYVSESIKASVIIIGHENTSEEKIRYLEAGAEIYINQPINPDELAAQVKALLRKSGTDDNNPGLAEFSAGNMQFIHTHRLVTVKGKEINLTPLEYGLLRELMLNAGTTLSYNHLLQKVWGPEYTEKQYVYLYISYLRKKIEADPSNPRYIVTVTRVGYLFKTEDNNVKK